MNKSEIFDAVVDKVCELCEVNKDDVMGGVKERDVVDARLLAVQYLRRIGFSNDEVALLALKRCTGDATLRTVDKAVKTKAKSVDKMFRAYSDRCLQSKMFCIISTELAKFLRDEFARLQTETYTPLDGE